MNEYKSDAELDREVLFVLLQHMGRDHSIGRWELVERIFGSAAVVVSMRTNNNLYDRQVRESIERARANGQHICNVGEGGYYVANNREEFRAFKRYYLGSALRRMQIMQAMDETADKRWGPEPKQADPMQAVLFGGV